MGARERARKGSPPLSRAVSRPQFPYPSLSNACHAGYEIRVFQDLHEARVKLLGSKGNSKGTVGRKGKKAKKKREKRWKSITYSH